MFVHGLVVIGILLCSIQAVRASRLLFSALWLAGSSALISLLLYLLGAPEVAVIELSVGAGLVTVLFVFAINITGEENIASVSLIPKPLAWGLTGASIFLLIWMNLDLTSIEVNILSPVNTQFNYGFWNERMLDVLLQIAIFFCGALGVLGLLSEIHPSTSGEGNR